MPRCLLAHFSRRIRANNGIVLTCTRGRRVLRREFSVPSSPPPLQAEAQTQTQTQTHAHEPIVTDEGIIIYESDPSQMANNSETGLGIVWGSVRWPSGIALAKYLAYISSTSGASTTKKPKRILELGSGTGIVGLTAAKLFPNSICTCTDSESALWPLLRKSIQANKLDDMAQIYGLDWGDISTFMVPEKHPFDLILAADVLYIGTSKLFARALAAHVPSRQENPNVTTEVFVANTFRKDSSLQDFVAVCHRLGLQLERLEIDGQAAGAAVGMCPSLAYAQSSFVPIVPLSNTCNTENDNDNDTHSYDHITTKPIFAPLNKRKVQIFRVTRISGTAEYARSLRRVSRI